MAKGESPSHPTKVDLDKVFRKNPNQTVDFEIVFAGLLASTLFLVSGISLLLDFLSIIVGIALLFFTMIRRMAVDNPFALEERLMDISLTVIFVATFFGTVYLAISLVELIPQWLNMNYYLSLGLLLFILIYGAVLLYEINFRDFFLWAGILFYNRHVNHREDATGNRLLKTSKWILDHSLTNQDELPDEVSKIHDIAEEETDAIQEIGSNIGITFGVIAFVGLLTLSGAIAWLVVTGSIFAFGLGFALLMAALIPLMGIVEFWFSRYGNASFSELTDLNKRFPIYFLAFFAIAIANPGTTNRMEINLATVLQTGTMSIWNSLSSISVSNLATISAIASPILILMTYKWSQLESAEDVETRLRNRLHETKTYAGPFVLQVTAFRGYEKSGFLYKLKKLLLFRTNGSMRVETFILQRKLPQEEIWKNPAFEEYCDSIGVEAEHISTTTEGIDGTGIIFRIHTLDEQKIEDFLKTVPDYLNILAEVGILEQIPPHGINPNEHDDLASAIEDIQPNTSNQEIENKPED